MSGAGRAANLPLKNAPMRAGSRTQKAPLGTALKPAADRIASAHMKGALRRATGGAENLPREDAME